MNLKAFLKITSSQLEMITQAIAVRKRMYQAVPFPDDMEGFWVKYQKRTNRMISIENHLTEILKEGNIIIEDDLIDLAANKGIKGSR